MTGVLTLGRVIVAVVLACAPVGLAPAIAVAAPVAAPAAAPSANAPAAAAWVLDASLLSGRHLVQLAEVRNSGGSVPSAWAQPLGLDNAAPVQALADAAHPDASRAKVDWHDPTGSATVQGGYASASVTPTSTTARAGVAAGSGSSFALASKYLSWDQQQRLTGTVASLNDALLDPVNKLLSGLGPLLSGLGLALPAVEKMSPLALIDVASASGAAASASTTYSPGDASAHADAAVTSLALLDGFVRIDGIHAAASSEDTGSRSLSAEATFGQVSIAGLPVRVGDHGIEVLGNSLLPSGLLQPLLDKVLAVLAGRGLTLRLAQTSTIGALKEATAVELDVATPLGTLALSIGHAEASAPPPPPLPATTGTSPPAASSNGQVSPEVVVPPAASVETSGGTSSEALAPQSTASTPPVSQAGTGVAARAGIPSSLGVALPRNAARALTTVFLLILLGGVGMAVVPTMMFGPAHRFRGPQRVSRARPLR